ncbi:MAG TPA: hypothetical protein VFQ53_18850 [Kofleriaceae bacterium]|nr:hypothetical protein [Kofleriaceae bacterium]
MRTIVARSTCFALLLAACGDNITVAPEQDGSVGSDASTPHTTAVVVAGDFTPGDPGVLSSLDVDTLEVTERIAPNGAVAEDPVLRDIDGTLYVINRAAGNSITVLERDGKLIEQLPTGAGSNPQDVAVVGDKLYVPAFNTAGVVVLTRGSTETKTISLANLDGDGKPNCVSAYTVDTDVYVACELLDANFLPRARGKVVVIDSATDTVRATLTLTFRNPFGTFERLPNGDLVIPTVPSFGSFTAGCVERIIPGATPAVGSCVVNNSALAGYVSRIALDPAGATMLMIVSKFDTAPHGRLRAFDLATSTLADPATPDAQVLVDAVVCPNGKLVVSDQASGAPGLRVYEGATEVTTEPLAIGLAPSSNHGLACF